MRSCIQFRCFGVRADNSLRMQRGTRGDVDVDVEGGREGAEGREHVTPALVHITLWWSEVHGFTMCGPVSPSSGVLSQSHARNPGRGSQGAAVSDGCNSLEHFAVHSYVQHRQGTTTH